MNFRYLNMLAAAALLCACQSAPKQTTITGTLTGIESDTLIVNYFPVSDLSRRTIHRDTIAMQQGKFTYHLANDSVPMEAWLYAKSKPGEAMALLAPYKTLGVPYPYTDLASAEALKNKGFALKDCMPALKDAMIVKSEKELSLIQTACTIAEDGFLALLPDIKEGMTEAEVAALLEYNMRKFGASGTSFETIVAFGAGASVPHHETGNTKLKFGDPILIDFGCKAEGYCSDITRTFLFGDDKKHEDFKKAYGEVLKAHELVKEKLTSGMTGREGDEIARGSLRAAGLEKLFTHSLGHGVGLLIHEYPRLAPASSDVLQDGMVFSDEPGVYEAGKFGIRIEDTVCLKGGRVHSFMSKTQRELLIL